jgi:long-chain acyl-CoA synthetase
MTETLRDILLRHAAAQGGRELLIAPETGATLTYAAFAEEARSLAGMLGARGLERGDVVAFFLENGLQATILFLGLMAAGHVVAPFNLLAQRSQLAYVLEHSGCRVVFTSAAQRSRLDEAMAILAPEIRARIAILVVDPDRPGQYGRDGDFASAIAPENAALLMYTSGTTGVPKGAVMTHTNLVYAGRSVSAWHGLGPEDRVLSSLPLYHINGQCIATVTPFVSGGSIVAPRKFSVSQWWGWVERHAPTWLNMVPTIIAYLLNGAEAGRRYAFPSVRFGRSASAPLPPDQHRAFEKLFGIGVIEAMGMTETSSVVFCNPQDSARRKYGTPGLPCGVEAKVITSAGTPLADDLVGEICLRGPNVMREYHREPAKTRDTFDAEGWLRTGDLGYRDRDGFYFITGRIKELIIKGGENIAPREIDEALLRHPAVLEAAAVGIPDRDYGQDILAAIVLKPGAACREEELRAFCLDELGRFKTPKTFRFVADLPKGPSGKVQRLKLVER